MVQYLHFRILKLNLKFPLISWLQLLCSLSLSLSLQQTPAVRKRLSNSTALRCEHLVSNSSGKHVRQETRVEWSVLYIEKTLQICEILSGWVAECSYVFKVSSLESWVCIWSMLIRLPTTTPQKSSVGCSFCAVWVWVSSTLQQQCENGWATPQLWGVNT